MAAKPFQGRVGQRVNPIENCESRTMLSASPAPVPAPTVPPQVSAVYVSSTGWSSGFKNQLAASGKGSSTFGYAIPTGAEQTRPLGWSGLNQVSLQFSQGVSVAKDDLVIRGAKVPEYAVSGFNYNASAKTATWTLKSGLSFTNDRLTFDLDADRFQTAYDSGGFEKPTFTPGNLAGQGQWVRTNLPGAGVVQNNVVAPGGGSQAVSITRDKADERWAVLQSLNNVTAPVVVQWDLYAKQASTSAYGPYFAVEAYDAIGNAPRLAGSAGIDASTGDVLYQATGTGYVASTGNTVSLNAWHHFDMVLDYATHTYSVYVDGVQRVANVGFVDHTAATPINDLSDAPIAALASSGDAASLLATGQAYYDNYRIASTTQWLDGEWVNGASQFPSGNGAAGGDFRFAVNVLAGDTDGNGAVDFLDLLVVAKNYGKPASSPAQGDFNADGRTGFEDLLTQALNYGQRLPSASLTAPAPRTASVAADLFNATRPITRPAPR